VHLFLLIRHGISEPPRPGLPVEPRTYRKWYADLLHREGEPFWPDAAWKDVVFALAVGSVVLALAVVIGPPELGAQADPTLIQAYPRPDWYFLWYFALLALLPPGIEDWFIIGFPLLAGILFLILPFIAPYGERAPSRRPWAIGVVLVAAVAVGTLAYLGERAPWSPDFNPQPLPLSVTQNLQGQAAKGAQLFRTAGCQNCHAIGDAGGQRGPDLSAVGSRLTREQLTWRILYGGYNMPAFGSILSPDETAALVEFLAQQRGR
jgi:ubiquinol-cytochrome c reductase cytochrome b subunit